MREAALAEVAAERSHVVVAPVVDDQARALRKLLLAATEVADELSCGLIFGSIIHLDPLIGAFWHSLETSVWLRTSDVLAD